MTSVESEVLLASLIDLRRSWDRPLPGTLDCLRTLMTLWALLMGLTQNSSSYLFCSIKNCVISRKRKKGGKVGR